MSNIVSHIVEEGRSVNPAGLLSWLLRIMYIFFLSEFLIAACLGFIWHSIHPQVIFLFPCMSLVLQHHPTCAIFFLFFIKKGVKYLSQAYPVTYIWSHLVSSRATPSPSSFPLPPLIPLHLASVATLARLICVPANIHSYAATLLSHIQPFYPSSAVLLTSPRSPPFSASFQFPLLKWDVVYRGECVHSLSPAAARVLGGKK